GGPIKKDRTFFFTSYEWRRIRQGIPSPAVTVPTAAERPDPSHVVNGHIVADFSAESQFAGVLNSSYALQPGNQIGQRPGCQQAVTAIGGGLIQDGANYFVMFPNNQLPLECMDATDVDLLQFVPVPIVRSNATHTSTEQAIMTDIAIRRLLSRMRS